MGQGGIPITGEAAFWFKVGRTTNSIRRACLARPIHFDVPDEEERGPVREVDNHGRIRHDEADPVKERGVVRGDAREDGGPV